MWRIVWIVERWYSRGLTLVIDEGRGQARLAGMDRQKLDSLLALAVGVTLEAVTLFHELRDARCGS